MYVYVTRPILALLWLEIVDVHYLVYSVNYCVYILWIILFTLSTIYWYINNSKDNENFESGGVTVELPSEQAEFLQR